MRVIFIFFIAVIFLAACQDAPNTGISEVKKANLYTSGARLAKFNGDTGVAVIFVDADQNLLSIHSLNKDLAVKSPSCVEKLSAISGAQDIESLRALLGSSEHYIWLAEVDPNYEEEGGCDLGLCCEMLQVSEVSCIGTGYIEYSNFVWDAETTNNMNLDMSGVGELKDLSGGNGLSYISRSRIVINIANRFHADIDTRIDLIY